LFAAVLALVGLLLWGLLDRREVSSSAPLESPQDPEERPGVRAPSATPEGELEYAADGLPIKPGDPEVPVPEGPMHPHPITPEHERIFRENNLVAALNLAVDLQDAVRIRELVVRYRAEYPEDDHVLQDGYEIIADCLEDLDEATRARAQRFWETQIRSQTRRYVRRHCLEAKPERD
jgi:hypothetical protein